MLCTGGKDPVDESEIDQFLADIGFEADKFVNINDFAQFLLEWIKTFQAFYKAIFCIWLHMLAHKSQVQMKRWVISIIPY